MQCVYCDEEITPADRVAVRLDSMHYECGIRAMVGSVAHLLHQCGCYVPGSEKADPPGLTLRQAAIEALDVFRRLEAVKAGAASN